MLTVTEEFSNFITRNMQHKSPENGGFFAARKRKETLMYAKLDKLREDLKKAVAKRDSADAKVKQLEAKLKEEENQQIVNDVASYNLSPEQLAQFLQLTKSGKLQELLSGQVPMPGALEYDPSADKTDESSTAYGNSETDHELDEMTKEEEDLSDEEDE